MVNNNNGENNGEEKIPCPFMTDLCEKDCPYRAECIVEKLKNSIERILNDPEFLDYVESINNLYNKDEKKEYESELKLPYKNKEYESKFLENNLVEKLCEKYDNIDNIELNENGYYKAPYKTKLGKINKNNENLENLFGKYMPIKYSNLSNKSKYSNNDIKKFFDFLFGDDDEPSDDYENGGLVPK